MSATSSISPGSRRSRSRGGSCFRSTFPGLSLAANGFLANLFPLQSPLRDMVGRRASQARRPREAIRVRRRAVPKRARQRPPTDQSGSRQSGPRTEIVFVEGGSRDGTREEIQSSRRGAPRCRPASSQQSGSGKGNAVRDGFAAAENELLMILDGDLSVRPEELPGFYRAWSEGTASSSTALASSTTSSRARCGSRTWSATRCSRCCSRRSWASRSRTRCAARRSSTGASYERIAAGRSYFGEFDPFGDFDLLLGAARLNLKIVDLPVRYQPRTYGETNISRWRHGLLLLTDDAIRLLEVPRRGHARPATAVRSSTTRQRKASRGARNQHPSEAREAPPDDGGDELSPREAA